MRSGWKREQQVLLNEMRTHERLARQQKRLPQSNASNGSAGGPRARPASTEGQVRTFHSRHDCHAPPACRRLARAFTSSLEAAYKYLVGLLHDTDAGCIQFETP